MQVAFFGLCVLAFGILGILAVASDVRLFVQLRRRGVAATAEVVGVNTRSTGVPGGTHRYPVLRFTTADEEIVTTELRLGKLRGASIGDRVYIQYLPKRPKTVGLWDGDFRFSATLWSVLACVFLIVLGVRMMSG